jgi:uncharacterized protein (TIGR00369 family)
MSMDKAGATEAGPLIEAIFSGRSPRPPVGILLGTEYVSYDIASGTVHMRFTAAPSFVNPAGMVHGGMLAAMMDELLAVTMTATMREGQFNVTLDLGTRFLKAAQTGVIEGHGKVVKRGRSVGFAEGELRNAAGDVLARGNATMHIQDGFPVQTQPAKGSMNKPAMHDPKADAARVIETVANGGVAVFPVDVGYAIVGNSEAAIARVFACKKRSFEKACGMFSNRDMFMALARVGEREVAIVDSITRKHGLPFSVVVPYHVDHPFFSKLTELTRERSSRGDTIDMLLNVGALNEEIARLSWERGMPVLGSSANTSLSGSKYRFTDVEQPVRGEADLTIDYGDTKYSHPDGMGSSIIALPSLKPIRRGIMFDRICDIIAEEFGTDPRMLG